MIGGITSSVAVAAVVVAGAGDEDTVRRDTVVTAAVVSTRPVAPSSHEPTAMSAVPSDTPRLLAVRQ